MSNQDSSDFITPEFSKFCRSKLKNLIREVSGLEAVMIATLDGFQVAHYLRDEETARKLAAVSSSTFSLGVVMMQEGGLNFPSIITIDADNGKVLLCAVNTEQLDMVLYMQTKPKTLLGQLIHSAKRTAEEIYEYKE